MQLNILEDAKERFIQEQKLEADLILLKENHDKELNALHEQHMQELVEKETMYNEDYAMKEKELREKQLTNVPKTKEIEELEAKVAKSREEENWDEAGLLNERLIQANRKNE